MIDRVVGKEPDQRNWLRSLHPMGRLGATDEIAAAVLYPASHVAKFTTGTTLLVDGGWTAARSSVRVRRLAFLFEGLSFDALTFEILHVRNIVPISNRLAG
jgi:Enoyl-(Acyl carrier protein) reductase